VIDTNAALGADDRINGGDGHDALTLNGDYSSGLVFADTTLTQVEEIDLNGGYSYDLTLSDRAAASADGQQLAVSGGGFSAGQHIVIDASAFEAGHRLQFTLGDDTQASSTIIGGAADDTVTFQVLGRWDVTGGGGSDTVAIYDPITGHDHFHGGAGDNDTLVMLAGQTAVLTGGMIDDVETLWVFGDDYDITMRDTAVAAGHSLHVYGGDLEAGQHLAFDGAAERDGTYTITGGADSDTLAGGRGADSVAAGAGDDLIRGGLGGDLLSGEDGADTFIYGALAESGHHGEFDLITDLSDADLIDLSAIDARTDRAGDQAFRMVDAFDGHAGEAKLHYAAGQDITVLSVDVDGDAHADMRIQIAGDHEGFSHFVL
jgi:Ca2+-binding RTX toxin-like protein